MFRYYLYIDCYFMCFSLFMVYVYTTSKMAEKLQDLHIHNDLSDYYDNSLKLSLPDNDQTWLFCLPGSDPSCVMDLTEFLDFKSTRNAKFSKIEAEDDNTQSYVINTRTFTRQKKQYSYGSGKKQIIHPNKNVISPDGSCRMGEKAPISNNPSQSICLINSSNSWNLKKNNIIKIEKNDTNQVLNHAVDVTPKLIINESIKNNLKTKGNNISNSWDITERTLLMDISAPKGLSDSTVPSDNPPLFNQAFLSFMPKSVSTPTKNLIDGDNKKYNIHYTPEKLEDLHVSINNNTVDSVANNTYSVLIENKQDNDEINSNVTQFISNSKIKLENLADASKVEEDKNILYDTFILKCSIEENVPCDANDPKPLSINIQSSLPFKDDMHNKSDEHINVSYNKEPDLNSTIIIKSKDNDSELDSCYSSSTNLRSLNDVCAMSQLLPQKNSNFESTLKKARSEDDLLCSSQDIDSKVDPKIKHGSALNLASHKINQLAGVKHLRKPQYFLRSPEKSTGQPVMSLSHNVPKHMDVPRTTSTRLLSKIPRPQSRIPKLNLKKV